MTATTLLCFLGTSAALTIAPGPDNTFVVAQGISRGRKAAIVTGLGMCSGVSVHTLAAALGVSAILYSSALAFTMLKYAGAAYLIYLACMALREHGLPASRQPDGEQHYRAMFRRGFLMNVVNPKVGLFFLAFLPQFVSPGDGSQVGQMLLLGSIFMLQATVIFSLIGFLSGSIGNTILKHPEIGRYFGWLTAGVLAALGLRLAMTER